LKKNIFYFEKNKINHQYEFVVMTKKINISIRKFKKKKQKFFRTSSSLITGESRSVLSSSCFSHSNIFISSFSVVELPPPPGSEVINDNEELSAVVAFIDDIDRLDEDFIERSSVKSVVLD